MLHNLKNQKFGFIQYPKNLLNKENTQGMQIPSNIKYLKTIPIYSRKNLNKINEN